MGPVVDFKVDELVIVAVTERDYTHLIVLFNFLPVCNHCKRLTKPSRGPIGANRHLLQQRLPKFRLESSQIYL